MNRLIEFVINKHKYVVIITLLFVIPMAYLFLGQKFINHIDVFFDKDDPDIMTYKKFQEIYGNEELIAIVFKDQDIFTNKNIELIRKITAMAKKAEGVQRVASITNHMEIVCQGDDLSFQKIIPDGKLNKSTLQLSKKKALDNEVIANMLISSDGRTASIMIILKSMKSNEKKKEVVLKIKSIANEIAGSKTRLRFIGGPLVELEINNLSERDFYIFTPLVFFIIFTVASLMLRNGSLAILCMFDLQVTLILGLGLFTICGESLNIVTMIIGPILLAIAVADSIHVLGHYKDEYILNGKNHIDAVAGTIRSLWLPCLFTSLTTGIGFFSFITSAIRPVKVVGIYTATGIMIAFIMTITFLPAALILFQRYYENDYLENKIQKKTAASAKENEGLIIRILLKIGAFSTDNPKTISIFFIFIIILSVIGISKVKFETNIINYLHDDNEIKSDINFIEKNLSGSVPFVMLIQAKSKEDDFTHPGSLKLIADIQNDIVRDINKISNSFSVADYFKEMNKAFNSNNKKYYKIPEKQSDIIDFYLLGDSELLRRIISADRREAVISFQSTFGTNEEARKIAIHTTDYLKKKLTVNHSYKFTGLTILYLTMEYNLQQSQLRSFLIAFLIIFFMMFFICKTIKLTIISMVPNLFPIFITLGIMGWFNIPLDVSTIMIASVTLGIAVDDTIHYLVWFRRNISSGMDSKPALLKALKDVGKPIVITSLALLLGFIVLLTGSIKPTQTFGALTALAMLLALVGDLFLLPAIILIFKPEIKTMKPTNTHGERYAK